MTTVRVLTDVKPPVIAALRAFFAVKGYRVSDEVPKDWVLENSPPLVTVHDDGGSVDWPVMSHPMIRVTVRARGGPLAKSIAGLANGYIRENPIPGIANVHRTGGTAIIDGFDTDTGADLASFTVNVTAKTALVDA